MGLSSTSAADRAAMGFTTALAALAMATLAGQHPHPSFERLRKYDVFSSALPNWRFFAPVPAMHDYHVFYRTMDGNATATDWKELSQITPRSPMQVAFFPNRRREKGLFDAAAEIIRVIGDGAAAITNIPAYQLLLNYSVKTATQNDPDAHGLQFCLVQYTGHDETTEPEILFASPYVSLKPANKESHEKPKSN